MLKFHKVVSFVLQPLLMPTFGIILLVMSPLGMYFNSIWKWFAVSGTFLFTALMPAIPILMMLRNGQIKDLYISKKEQRTMPYLFSLVAYFFWTLFMWRILKMPLFLVGMGVGSTLSLIAILLINRRWKISAHLSGIGGLTGGIFGYSYFLGINPLGLLVAMLVLSGLTALSRIELKAHTPGQTLAGFTVGFLMVFLPPVLLRLFM
jgi:membrane-associated phospholipid phosphatase